MKKTWRSPVYGFFKSNVQIGTEGSWTYHFFECAAICCKVKGGGVQHYQDSQDHATISNLKAHAIRCFGDDADNAAFNKTTSGTWDGSILHVSPDSVKPQYQLAIVHIQWMKQGSLFVFSFIFPLTTSTNSLPSFRAHIARWCAESNWPMNLVKDREFSHLMKARCPGTSIPTPATVGHDIKISFEKSRKWIDKILKVSLTFNSMAALLIYFY